MRSERHKRILDVIEQKDFASVSALSKYLGVSEVTIRSDLRELEAQGLLVRVHGGARMPDMERFEITYAAREAMRIAEKTAIGKAAASLVDDNDVIALDGSTTVLQFARHLTAKKLTVVTNGVYAALELGRHPDLTVILVGGVLRLEIGSVITPMPEVALSNIHVRKLFVSPAGIDLNLGLTDVQFEESNVKRAMVQVAQQIIVLADHTKFGRVSLTTFAPIEAISTLVTDDGTDPDLLAEFEKRGIKVVIAHLHPSTGPSEDPSSLSPSLLRQGSE